MIPHRMLSSEIYGNGLRNRVTACRKRLRVSRGTHRAQVNDGAEELFPETTPSVSESEDYAVGHLPECSSISASVVRVDYPSSFAVAEPEGDSMLLAGKQEVGIT